MDTPKHSWRLTCLVLAIFLFGASNSNGQTSSSHTVKIGISPISIMSISGDPLPFIVEKVAGSDRVSARDATTFYNLTTNIENVFIQVELDLPMPKGTELWVSGFSTLGSSHGKVRLQGNGALPIVSGIGPGLENGQPIEYEFVATKSAKEVLFQSRNVTLTIVDRKNSRQQQHIQTIYFSTLDSPNTERN